LSYNFNAPKIKGGATTGDRYIYDKYGRMKAIVLDDGNLIIVIDVHKGVVGNVLKAKGGLKAMATSLKKGVVGYTDSDDDAIALLLSEEDDD